MARLGDVKGKTNQQRPQILDARALSMVDARIHGKTLAQIAEEFNVSVDTVKRSLTRAEKFDLAARYEDFLYGRLGALALGSLEGALADPNHKDNVAVAVKVLESIGVIRKPKDHPLSEGEGGEETWEAFLKVRKTRRGNGERQTEPSGPESIDAEIVDAGPESAGEEELSPEDGENPDPDGVSTQRLQLAPATSVD
jgi:DNA-binding CsgD family transcriptional regulator